MIADHAATALRDDLRRAQESSLLAAEAARDRARGRAPYDPQPAPAAPPAAPTAPPAPPLPPTAARAPEPVAAARATEQVADAGTVALADLELPERLPPVGRPGRRIGTAPVRGRLRRQTFGTEEEQ